MVIHRHQPSFRNGLSTQHSAFSRYMDSSVWVLIEFICQDDFVSFSCIWGFKHFIIFYHKLLFTFFLLVRYKSIIHYECFLLENRGRNFSLFIWSWKYGLTLRWWPFILRKRKRFVFSDIRLELFNLTHFNLIDLLSRVHLSDLRMWDLSASWLNLLWFINLINIFHTKFIIYLWFLCLDVMIMVFQLIPHALLFLSIRMSSRRGIRYKHSCIIFILDHLFHSIFLGLVD